MCVCILPAFLLFVPMLCYCGYTEMIQVCVCCWFPQAGLHKLELNPYWKDGGRGLPPEETAGTAAKKGNNRSVNSV